MSIYVIAGKNEKDVNAIMEYDYGLAFAYAPDQTPVSDPVLDVSDQMGWIWPYHHTLPAIRRACF